MTVGGYPTGEDTKRDLRLREAYKDRTMRRRILRPRYFYIKKEIHDRAPPYGRGLAGSFCWRGALRIFCERDEKIENFNSGKILKKTIFSEQKFLKIFFMIGKKILKPVFQKTHPSRIDPQSVLHGYYQEDMKILRITG